MKNYSEINDAVADLESTKTYFQLLSCLFYTRLLEQLEEVIGIPSTNLIKFEHNDHDRAETLDECVGIEDIYAVAKIGIVFQDKLTHVISFRSHKVGYQRFSLLVECRAEQQNFEFTIIDEDQISQIDFSEVITFISSSIDKYYKQWTSKFNLTE